MIQKFNYSCTFFIQILNPDLCLQFNEILNLEFFSLKNFSLKSDTVEL